MRRFNLDTYIQKNESGYLVNDKGSLFVEVQEKPYNDLWLHSVSGDLSQNGLTEITRDEFIERLLKK